MMEIIGPQPSQIPGPEYSPSFGYVGTQFPVVQQPGPEYSPSMGGVGTPGCLVELVALGILTLGGYSAYRLAENQTPMLRTAATTGGILAGLFVVGALASLGAD